MVLEFTSRRRPVQDLRSEAREPHCDAGGPAANPAAPAAGRFSGDRVSRACWWIARWLSGPILAAKAIRGWRRAIDNLGSLGLPRSSVSRPQHGRAACQPAGRGLSAWRHDFAAPGAAALLAGQENRSLPVLGRTGKARRRLRSSCGKIIPRATTMTGSRSRSPSFRNFWMAPRAACRATGHSGAVDYIRPYPSAGASSELELYLSVDICEGLAPGFYHYDAGAHALVPDRGSRDGGRSAIGGSRIRNGCDRSAPDPDHDRRALRPGFVEIQLDRLCAYSEGCRRSHPNALPDGDRDGTRRMRDRDREYRSVREDDGDRIPCRGPGRSICHGPRRSTEGLPADAVLPGPIHEDRAARSTRSIHGHVCPSARRLPPEDPNSERSERNRAL